MNDDLTPGECQLLDALHEGSIPTGRLHGPTLSRLIACGFVEVTWAKRARLTGSGRDLFRVVA